MKHNDDNREQFARDAAEAASADPTSTETAELPDMVGMDLDSAQEIAKVYGFRYFIDEDHSGQDRLQILDNEWTVCTQDPAPGTERMALAVVVFVIGVVAAVATLFGLKRRAAA
ncbi:PASTA domain-containing protein [Streptomyces xantholiticus]